ncbi:MAG TPA: hypothetical protein VGL06_08980 [Pseudonocardiaceae bacterium]
MTRIAAGATLAAAGLGMAACQPGGVAAGNSAPSSAPPSSAPATGSPSDGRAVAAALGKTTAAGSARIATATQVGVGRASLPITATGVIGFAGQTVDLTETLPGNQGTGETRFVDGVLYERLPGALVSGLSGGKPWLALDVNTLSGQGGNLQPLIADVPTDPSTILGFLRGAGDQVDTIGPETVDGTPTTHYTVLIDLDKAAEGQNTQAQNAVHVLEQQLGTHTIPAQVWLDGEGRLRKIAMRETLTGAATSTPPTTTPNGNISFDFTATLSDFGVPVDITAPPANQTTDLTKLLNGNH